MSSPAPRRRGVLRAALLPLLVATFPVVYLWASNLRNQILISDVVLVFVAVWVGTTATFLVFLLIVRDAQRASLATTVVAVLVLSFGHVARLAPVYPDTVGATTLLLAFGLLGAAGVVVALKANVPSSLISTLTFVAGALVALNLGMIVVSGTPVSAAGLPNAGDHVEIDGASLEARGARDVYYLIFDRYANEATLREKYGFDNSPFLDGLEARGFHVVHDAVANYPGTAHSLASSLNLTYLDDLAADVGPESDDWRPLLDSLSGSIVQRTFDEMGYRTVHIGTWWGPTFSDPNADTNYVYRELREFPGAFLFTTAVPWLADELGIGAIPDASEDQFHRIHFQADAILEVAGDPGPTFTFAHFTLPHSPYVVDAEGNFIPPGGEVVVERDYIEQLKYTNTLIDGIVDGLLRGPDATDPIVVLQSDEGPHPIAVDESPDPKFDWSTEPLEEVERKLRILSAVYFPGHEPGDDAGGPMPTRTPVNTFRAIFDRYFGADLPLLPDRSFIYVTNEEPYRFDDVSAELGLTAP